MNSLAHPFPATVLASAIFAGCLAVPPGLRAQTTFTKITTGDIVNDVGDFNDRAWGDYNNDGFLDLFVSGSWGQRNVLYRNNRNGTFTKVTGGDLVADADGHVGCIWSDYDNDGNLDLFVSSTTNSPSSRPNQLFHNNGDGTFTAISVGSPTNQFGLFGKCAGADYDNDGFLDFFVGNVGDWNLTGGKNLLMHNDGDGTFRKITSGAIVNDIGVAWSAQWADYDNDGLVDLFVVNNNHNGGGGVNFLYHNNGDGTFSRVLTNTVARDSFANGANCCAWGDYDNDGLQDLFVVADKGGEPNRLYHNNGNGTFTKIPSGPMLTPPAGGFSVGCSWGDYDNDGYLDLFVANFDGKNQLFHNNQNGTFTQVLTGNPVDDGGPGAACSLCGWVDYDNDGFLDLLVAIRPFPGSQGNVSTNLLYHNEGNTNAWLEVKLIGTVSNRSAIGAKVKVHATIGGKQFWQLREINTGAGYNIVPLVTHFGLGDATNADTVRIEWPSRAVQEFHDVPLKQIWTVTEPPRLSASLTNGSPQFLLKGGRGFQYDIAVSTDLAAWFPLGTLTITNLMGTAQIVDTNAQSSDRRFYRAVAK